MKLEGKGTEGDFVLKSQELASKEGFGHVAKAWYKKTISYQEGLEQLECERHERHDIEANLKQMKPSFDGESVGFESEDGQFFKPTFYAWSRIANWFGMPTRMPQWFIDKGEAIDQELLFNILRVQAGRQDQDKIFKWRTYNDGTLRSMLSQRYDYIDNRWVIEQLENLIPDGRLSHWRGNGDTIYGNLLIPDTIREEDDSDYGGMLSLSNCEIGIRKFSQYPSLFRAICMNGCIWSQTKGESISTKHMGIDLDTLRVAMAKNLNSQIPLIPSIVDRFLALRGPEYNLKHSEVLGLLADTAKREGLTYGSKSSQIVKVLEEYSNFEEHNKNLFGIVNAITRAGQKFSNSDWVKLDEVGGKLASLSPEGWKNQLRRSNSLTSNEIDSVFSVA